MTVIELLQKKFEATGYATVTDWMRESRVDLSLQSCTSVLLRGQDKGLVVMLTLASALSCTPEEMQWVAKEKGDKTLWRLITKEPLSKEDKQLLEAYHALSASQKKIVIGMMREMGGK